MPGVAVDEAAIRAAIDAGVRAALAALEPAPVVDEYPDYDEFPEVPFVAVAETQVSVDVAQIGNDRPENDAEDDTIEAAGGFGNVVPMSTTPSAAHTVSQDWLAAQWEREPEYVRNPPMHPHFVDMWAGV